MTVSLEEMLAEESEESRARIYQRAAEVRAEINQRKTCRASKSKKRTTHA